MTIAVRISACGSGLAVGAGGASQPVRNDRRHLARHPAGGEDQQVHGIAEQRDAEQHADDVLRQHQVDRGGEEQADEQRRARLPSAVLPRLRAPARPRNRADDDQIDADVEGHHASTGRPSTPNRSDSRPDAGQERHAEGQRQQAGQRRQKQAGAGDRQRMEMQRAARRRRRRRRCRRWRWPRPRSARR